MSPLDGSSLPKLVRSCSHSALAQSLTGAPPVPTLLSRPFLCPSTSVGGCPQHISAPIPLPTVRSLISPLPCFSSTVPLGVAGKSPISFASYWWGEGRHHSLSVLWNVQLVPQFPQLLTLPELSQDLSESVASYHMVTPAPGVGQMSSGL